MNVSIQDWNQYMGKHFCTAIIHDIRKIIIDYAQWTTADLRLEKQETTRDQKWNRPLCYVYVASRGGCYVIDQQEKILGLYFMETNHIITLRVLDWHPMCIGYDKVSNSLIICGMWSVWRQALFTKDPFVGKLELIAGNESLAAFQNGHGSAARLNFINSMAIDPSDGHIYVSDNNNHCIRCIIGKQVSTLFPIQNPRSLIFEDNCLYVLGQRSRNMEDAEISCIFKWDLETKQITMVCPVERYTYSMIKYHNLFVTVTTFGNHKQSTLRLVSSFRNTTLLLTENSSLQFESAPIHLSHHPLQTDTFWLGDLNRLVSLSGLPIE